MAGNTAENRPNSPGKKPIVIGVYGLPGSGKTTMLNGIKGELQETSFAYYDGSAAIDSVVPGGLETFKKLHAEEQVHWRQKAIENIKKECLEKSQTGLVAGHAMFWQEGDQEGTFVYTKSDLEVYTHILYLNIPAEKLLRNRQNDSQRLRPQVSIGHLEKWQEAEKTELLQICRDNGILFSLITPGRASLVRIVDLIEDFHSHSQNYNNMCAENALDKALAGNSNPLETILAFDADRTLSPDDTGAMFWNRALDLQGPREDRFPLKTLFGGPLGHSYTAFRQAVLLYEDNFDWEEYDKICQQVADEVAIYREVLSFLQMIATQKHMKAIIITCGLAQIWQKVIEREGLSDTVKVIGGGRIRDKYVITPETKGGLVVRLQESHGLYVWAFGDSPLDLKMLKEADEAIVIVGEEATRSSTMESELSNAIDHDGLQARQVVLPSSATPRLDSSRLPVVELMGHEFIDSVVCHRSPAGSIPVLHATDKGAAKLLMSPMRDARISGPELRQAHHNVGRYLGLEYLTEAIGTEEYPIPHVQGHDTVGSRLAGEQGTMIVALMRGGEPMALGVSDVFPKAMFLHAYEAGSITATAIEGKHTVFLVDSVVNSGKSIAEFVQHIHKLNPIIRIVVVTGVLQEKSISSRLLTRAFVHHKRFSIVALRISKNKFTGSGGTDTGNRLFGTTHLA
ncbi:hypothetical protein FQN57_005049 [Myotisia sp. PD_48]|nr:hypothetical protein FQN57_005049 [Myotisia sp. PD_48]